MNQKRFRIRHESIFARDGITKLSSMNQKLKTHWTADMYPLNESDVEALAASIKANGQRTPIMALKDGTIIDGRNRWLACQKAGVEPLLNIINPDGEDVPDEVLWNIATDCNSMRRDMTSSLRACLAAESWKRLYPDGKPNVTRVKKGDERKAISCLSFEDFAKDKFKVNHLYAKQALAILNHSPELLEDAKNGLAEAYKVYQARAAEDRLNRQNMKLLDDPASSDIRERVANNNLALEEAITLLRKRHADELSRIQAEAESRKIGRKQIQNIAQFDLFFRDSSLESLIELYNTQEGEEPISATSARPFGRDEMLNVAKQLTALANEIGKVELLKGGAA
jgi:hypothetical protein